jgi:signal transduction histidine kinase
VQNAQEASELDEEVIVEVTEQDDLLLISVIDHGCGMSDSFIKTRLFKPFDTTKGNAGMGIGAYEAKQFVEGLGGSISVSSVEDQGSTFTLAVPNKNK